LAFIEQCSVVKLLHPIYNVFVGLPQCSQSTAHLYEQFLQVQQIMFVTLGPMCCA